MADDDDDIRESEDDVLEESRRDEDGLFHPETDEEKLAEDNDRPAAPADDVPSAGQFDEPADDTDVDEDELYQQGTKEAAANDDQTIELDDHPKPLELDHEDDS